LAVNPGQRARARLIGGTLYAVRQHLRRRAARRALRKRVVNRHPEGD
jgi:hypothetical protein